MGIVDKRRDHFVARTYLRRFAIKGKHNEYVLNVYDRASQKYITVSPENICCEVGWDIIDNLHDKYILRKILQIIEPNLSKSIDKILAKNFSIDDRITLSWYLGIVFLLNPEYLYSIQSLHENVVKASADVLIDSGRIEVPPEIENLLGGKHNFYAKVNMNYVKAMIAKLLPDTVLSIYNLPWFIISNNSKKELLTSDRPFYFMCCPKNAGIYPKYIALDPKHLLFLPPPNVDKNYEEPNKFDVKNANKIGFINIDDSGVDLFNKYTISNANRFIIAHNITEELKDMIKKNIKFKTSEIHGEFPEYNGRYIFSTICCTRKLKDQKKEFELLMQILSTALKR